MAQALERAVEVRADIAEWLFAERCPAWDLAMVMVGEYHSAAESMWHGIDASHPLYGLASAAPARTGIEKVYEAGDRLLGRLIDRFPDARFVVFNLHGMGPNDSDAASMLLLPELLYRQAFGQAALQPGGWATTAAGVPLMSGAQNWDALVDKALPVSLRGRGPLARRVSRLVDAIRHGSNAEIASVDWMPGARYRRFWPAMRAFALPSYYDGRVRINLKGREAQGLVEPADYEATCDEAASILHDCRNAITGEPVVARLERSRRAPGDLSTTEADMVVVWRGAPLGFSHARLGEVGPAPYRRTGGHTGKSGFAYLAGPGIGRADLDMRSAFDVVPTVLEMLGVSCTAPVSGASFHASIASGAGEVRLRSTAEVS